MVPYRTLWLHTEPNGLSTVLISCRTIIASICTVSIMFFCGAYKMTPKTCHGTCEVIDKAYAIIMLPTLSRHVKRSDIHNTVLMCTCTACLKLAHLCGNLQVAYYFTNSLNHSNSESVHHNTVQMWIALNVCLCKKIGDCFYCTAQIAREFVQLVQPITC